MLLLPTCGLQVLYTFLVEFSEFDWDRYCLTLRGPVSLLTLPYGPGAGYEGMGPWVCLALSLCVNEAAAEAAMVTASRLCAVTSPTKFHALLLILPRLCGYVHQIFITACWCWCRLPSCSG